MSKNYTRVELERLFERANEYWDKRKLRSALRLFQIGAKAGDSGSQINLGNFYLDGIGLKPNRALALYWYRRAYQRGERCAANNMGIVFRDEKKYAQALRWFERAVDLGDGDANLEIAKIYISRTDIPTAVRYLNQTLRTRKHDVTEASKEEAQELLSQLKGSQVI